MCDQIFEMGTFYETHEQKFQTWTFFCKLWTNFELGTFIETQEQKYNTNIFLKFANKFCKIVKFEKKNINKRNRN